MRERRALLSVRGICLGLGLCCALPLAAQGEGGLIAFGLRHRPLGAARIGGGPGGAVEVAGPGGSGRAGVRVVLGEVEGFLLEVALPGGTLPAGAAVTASARGSIGGGEAQPAGSLSLRATVSGIEVVPDFGPLGAATFTVRVFDGGRMVHERSGVRGPAARIAAHAGGGRFAFGPGRMSFELGRGRVLLPGGAEAYGDAIHAIQEGAGRTVERYTSGAITAAGIPGFTLTGEEIELFQLRHRALGQGTLQPWGGTLTVTNPAGRRAAGVAVDLLQAASWRAELGPLDARALPTGANLLARVEGTVDGVPGRTVATARLKDVGDQLEATFDFAAMGAATYTAQVLLDGQVVDSQTGMSGPALRFDDTGCILDPLRSGSPARPMVSLAALEPTRIALTGHAEVLGDEVRAFPDAGTRTAELGPLGRLRLVSRGIPSFTILAESSSALIFDGLAQEPLSGSSLTEKGEELTVTAQGGDAGVLSRTGDSEGVLWRITLPEGTVPPGTVVETRSRGTIAGVPDQPAGGLTAEQTSASGLRLTPDFSALGTTRYQLQLFRDHQLVYSRSGMQGPAANVLTGINKIEACCRVLVYSANFFTDQQIQVVGGPLVTADLVIVQPEGATRETENHSAVTSVVRGLPSFSIAQQRPLLFGLTPHMALGEAIFDIQSGRLDVSNLGSAGQDGVDIDIGHFTPADSARVSWNPLDSAGTAPAGAFVQANAVGTVDGVPGRPLGQLRVTKRAAGSFEIAPDFSALSASTTRVQVYSAGRLVADLPGRASPVGTASTWPAGISQLAGGTAGLAAHHAAGTRFLIGGASYTGDEIRLLAEGQAGTVDSKSDLAFRAAGLSRLTIVSEQVVPVP